jgi:hypothetical protein
MAPTSRPRESGVGYMVVAFVVWASQRLLAPIDDGDAGRRLSESWVVLLTGET